MRPALPEYPERLRMVRELARNIPGVRYRKTPLGLFAGIYLQTQWQLESGRNSIPHWYLVNEMLTAAPYHYYRDFRADTESEYVPRDARLRKLWYRYFREAEEIQKRYRVRSLLLPFFLWQAHTSSMKFVIAENPILLTGKDITKEEFAFWKNWVRFILLGRYVPIPTTVSIVGPVLSHTMPTCSPLCPQVLKDESTSPLRKYFLKVFTA